MGLNATGSLVFGRVDGARTVAALAGEVAQRFGLAPERALADVGAFLSELVARGLLEEARP